MYIFLIFIQVLPESRKFVKWLMINRFYLFCVKFDFLGQKVHTLIFLVEHYVIWQIFFLLKFNIKSDFPDKKVLKFN